MITTRKLPIRRLAAVFLVALVIAACDIKGPDPTDAILTANSGPFGVGTVAVPSSAGFGGGTIYYPTGVDGPFAVISVAPGFTETASSLDWGPRLASHGFVTIAFNTSNTMELPAARSTEQIQALNYAISQSNNASSPIAGLVDPNRRGVMGHSMGGGGTLISEQNDPSLRTGMPLAPWNTSTNFSNVTVPTLVFACQNDNIAPVNQHASPMYNSIPASTNKSYISIAGQNHFCANAASGGSGQVGKFAVAWFKKFLDGDTRYDPWVCGASKPVISSAINDVRSTCPF
jgi:triacylglycerol lipase